MPELDLVVVGLGYVGLPLAVEATRAGLRVSGLDVDPGVVASLAGGHSHVDDVSDDDVAAALAQGLSVTSDASVVAASDSVVLCVPTPLSPQGGADLSAVVAAGEAVSRHLGRGSLVVLESTSYPGTTEEVLQPLLEAGGLVVGDSLSLAFSPERIDPGNRRWTLRTTPKVVGGVTPSCTARAVELYRAIVDDVVVAAGTREAEMAKLLENTYRHVNIALVNEMARFCHELGIDIWDVVRCAATKPFGFQPFWPGPGVGGHCIPVDPNYLAQAVRTRLGYSFRFVELAQDVNGGMPAYVVSRLQQLLNEDAMAVRGSRVLLLGVTYKRDIADGRESPAGPVAQMLTDLGAAVSYHDPFVPTWSLPGREPLVRAPDVEAAVAAADVVVLLQAHSAYDLAGIASSAARLLDTRGAVPLEAGATRTRRL